jgi:hypothetical protein
MLGFYKHKLLYKEEVTQPKKGGCCFPNRVTLLAGVGLAVCVIGRYFAA